MKTKDNPIAFPLGDGSELGMTLRDYFAAKALDALIAEALRLDHTGWQATTAHAYIIADAMLKERAKQ